MATTKAKEEAKAKKAEEKVKKVEAAKEKKVEVVKAKSKKKVNALKTSKDYEDKDSKYQSFDHFWAVMAHKHKLKINWKDALKAHIKKMGLDSSDKYEEGLKHFLGK